MHRTPRVAVRVLEGTLGIQADGEAASGAVTALDVAAWPGALHVLVPQ